MAMGERSAYSSLQAYSRGQVCSLAYELAATLRWPTFTQSNQSELEHIAGALDDIAIIIVVVIIIIIIIIIRGCLQVMRCTNLHINSDTGNHEPTCCWWCRLMTPALAVVWILRTTVWTEPPTTSLCRIDSWRPAWDDLWTRRSSRRPTASITSTAVTQRQAVSPTIVPVASRVTRWPRTDRVTTAVREYSRLREVWTSTGRHPLVSSTVQFIFVLPQQRRHDAGLSSLFL